MVVHTVLGPVAAGDLAGPVLPHEHLALDLRTDADADGVLDSRHAAAVAAELAEARSRHGLSLVVDQTCRGMGRDVRALQGIARRARVAVVASTGWYYGRFHPGGEPGRDVDHATELLLADLTDGLDGTEVLAGVVGEVGTHGLEPTAAERVSLMASGRAAHAAGRPLATHAHLGTGAMAQLNVLAETGLAASRVCIGHQDLTEDLAQHEAIAASGAFLGFDTIGKSSYQPDEVRLRLVLALLERGLGGHLLLSNDISRHGYLAGEGGQGYQHVLGPFARQLRDAGVDEKTLTGLYRDNALRWLTGERDIGTGTGPLAEVAA